MIRDTAKSIEEIDEQIARLNYFRDALSLLETIWLDLGPYTTVLEDTTRQQLRDFMQFDDSE